ncbi:MAG: hypothetical protein ACO2ZZ_02780 [Cyclobacteriaceae bacterium]
MAWFTIYSNRLTKYSPAKSKERSELLENVLKEKLDQPLRKIMNALPHMRFTEPKVVDSKDVAIETKVEGVTLKVFLRRKGIQVELRHRTVSEEETLLNHFNVKRQQKVDS